MEVSFLGKALKLDSADDAKDIVDAIEKSSLETLNLQGNTLGVDASKAISDALKKKPTFKNALWSDLYTGRLRSEIPQSLEFLGDGIIASGSNLIQLDLSDNAFGPDGVKAIDKLLRSKACYTLQILKLNNNGLGIGGGEILAKAFIDCHKSSKIAGTPFALKVFISGRNRLENEGAKALSEAFKILGSLEEIIMPQNGIRPEGVVLLAEAFKQNRNLKTININDNTCTVSGAKAIANCIPHLSKLENLDIGDCLVKDKGAKLLSSALAACSTLKCINLSFNEIRQDGALAVLKSIKDNNTLTLLNLDGNELESVDEIQEKMTEYGKIDVLASLDDNEDPDSEDESEGDDSENSTSEKEDEEESESEEKKATENLDDLSLKIMGMGLSNDSPLLKEDLKTNGTCTEISP